MFIVTIPVPNFYNDGRPAALTVEVLAGLAAELFGGVTITPGQGLWIDPNGKLVNDDLKVFTIFTDKPDLVPVFAQNVKIALEQDSVVYTIVPAEVQFI